MKMTRQRCRPRARLKAFEVRMLEAPDQQISLTDPDGRSMATSGRASGIVGYNVQAAVDVWDTQWDMFLALIGATLALIMLSMIRAWRR